MLIISACHYAFDGETKKKTIRWRRIDREKIEIEREKWLQAVSVKSCR